MFKDSTSLSAFWEKASPSLNYLFLSHGRHAAKDAKWLRKSVLNAGSALSNTTIANSLSSRLYFGTERVTDSGGWVGKVLRAWLSPRNIIIACSNSTDEDTGKPSCMDSTRLDVDYNWIPWPMTGKAGKLAWADEKGTGNDLAAAIALVPLAAAPSAGGSAPHQGSAVDIILRVQRAGATAVLFYPSQPSEDIFQLRCTSDHECSAPITIPVAMIPYEQGQSLADWLSQGREVDVNCTSVDGAGLAAGVDADGRLFEIGWQKYPSLVHVAWASQWQDYLTALRETLDAQGDDTVVVPVFSGENMTGEHGVRAEVTLPSSLWHLDGRQRYGRLLLDMELSCPGSMDSDCPVWDHAVQLFVCCNDPEGRLPPCEACPTTLWTPQRRGRMHMPIQGLERLEMESPPICGRELGRWMTPFRRRVGHWVTDASNYLPLLTSEQCTFTMQSAPWAGTWQPVLRLHFDNPGTASPRVPEVPHAPSIKIANHSMRKRSVFPQLVPLPFTSGIFDAEYNSRFEAFTFTAPVGLYKALIVSLITGHGSDENNCAEFCPTSHHFVVNGKEHSIVHDEAGTLWSCADRVADGVVPNQHGTWTFGRNNWCDGQPVAEWAVDITHDLYPPDSGRTNRIEYLAHFKDADPQPRHQPGYIMLSANLVLHGDGVHENASSF